MLAEGIPPEHAVWTNSSAPGLFDVRDHDAPGDSGAGARVPPALVALLQRVACHREPSRLALMYRVVWRVVHGESRLLDDAADDDVVTLTRFARSVDRARHKMTAFVRFREVATGEGARYVAWFEPEHDVLRFAAPFFVKRFGTMHWTIATPDGIASWDRLTLAFEEAAPALRAPDEDAAERLWLAYYEAIFNPARLNVRAMRREMPQRYWAGLPEAASIPRLVAQAHERAGRMVAATLDRDVAPYRTLEAGRPKVPRSATRVELDACRRCELAHAATQAVAGEGAADARIVLVGEQPGDDEDLAGKPFVGPAGRVLREALRAAGIDAARVYLTNAVKHFRYEPRGKRRLHKTPAQRHVEACRQWLEAELATLDPKVIVTLGATALFAVTGRKEPISQVRGVSLRAGNGAVIVATYHPAAMLRAVDEAARSEIRAALVSDLERAAEEAWKASSA